MAEIATGILTILAAVFGAVFTVAKLILPKILDVHIKHIEHIHNRDLKALEAIFHSQMENMKTAVEVAHKSQEELRRKRIISVESIWREIIRLEREFAPLVAAEMILTDRELSELFWDGGNKNEKLEGVFQMYSTFEKITQKIDDNDAGNFAMQLALAMGSVPYVQEESKIFVTDKIWRVYEAFITVYGRLGFLVTQAATKKEEVDWRTDDLMKSIIEKNFSKDAFATIQIQKTSMQTLINLLKRQFIVEAQKIMQGSELFYETTKEFHQIIESVDADSKNRMFTKH